MTLSYLGVGAYAENASASGTLAIPHPVVSGGILDNDVLVILFTNATVNLAATPSGWNVIASITGGGVSPSILGWWKYAVGGETGSVTVTKGFSAVSKARMYAWRDADLTNPIEDFASRGLSTANTAFPVTGIITAQAGSGLMYAAAANAATGSWNAVTVPAAWTEDTDDASPSPSSGFGHLLWSGSGDAGTIDVSRVGNVRGCALVVAIKPASGAPPADTSKFFQFM